MHLAILVLFALALAAPWLHRVTRAATGWVLAGVPLGLACYFASLIPTVQRNALRSVFPWVNTTELSVNLSFRLDGLSLLFALMICGIGALILVYSGGYLAGHPNLGRFYGFLLLFMASMLGVVLADNVLLLLVFWELTSISSYLLIGFDHARERARAAALQALLVTGGGGLALMAGVLLLGQIGGSYEITDLLLRGDSVRDSGLYDATLVLILLGAFTKSAQFPFHFWLPQAMEAPTPVSAYLHSATMVKAGIYLLARLSPVLAGTPQWSTLVTSFGAVTMLVGGFLALHKTDLKQVLAYSTISALGTLTLLLGLGGGASDEKTAEVAAEAFVLFLLAHAMYKGALFMVAGVIDHETGSRDVLRLGGLRRAMPVTAAVALLAALAFAGLPPALSFIGKEAVLKAALEASQKTLLVPAVVLAAALFVTVAGIVSVKPFWGATTETPRPAHEAPLSLLLGPAALAVLGFGLGIVPSVAGRAVVAPAVTAILQHGVDIELSLWHGFGAELAFSAVAITLGMALFLVWKALRRVADPLERWLAWGPERVYNGALSGLQRTARVHTLMVQHGYLRFYLMTTILTTIGLVGYTLFARGGSLRVPQIFDVRPHEVALTLLIVFATGAALQTNSRLTAIAALGVVGTCITLIYLIFGAPDLAMTQVLVETLTVILFVLAFYHLPRFSGRSSLSVKIRDAVIAASGGLLMTLLVLVAFDVFESSALTEYFAANSKTLAHGQNVVNVILVDFRGVDTLGEITVLSLAALGVFALLKLRPKQPQSPETSDEAASQPTGEVPDALQQSDGLMHGPHFNAAMDGKDVVTDAVKEAETESETTREVAR